MLQVFNRILKAAAGRYRLLSLAILGLIIGTVLNATHNDLTARWTVAGTAIIIALVLLNRMLEVLRSGTYSVNVIGVIAIVGAVSIRQYWIALFIAIVLALEEQLSGLVLQEGSKGVGAAAVRLSSVAHVIRGKKIIDTPVRQLRSGDRYLIGSGEKVPADSILYEGTGRFDESALTGVSGTVNKVTGDAVMSGSTALDDGLILKVTHPTTLSYLSRITSLLRSAVSTRTDMTRLVDIYGLIFMTAALIMGGIAWAVSGHAIRFIAALATVSVGVFGTAPTLRFMRAIRDLASLGIIVRTASSLEKMGRAQTMLLNKIGTVTEGHMVLSDILTFSEQTQDSVLGLAGSMAATSGHPVALAITRAAHERLPKISLARHVHETAGFGLSATVAGRKVYVGRLHLLDKQGINRPQGWSDTSVKGTAAYVAVDGQLAGALIFTDPIRLDAADVVSRLYASGIRSVALLTGDTKAASMQVAKKVGITEVYTDATPGEKLRVIEQAPYRPVAFVGDGIHDAPVLTAADVGVAFGAKSSVSASESADIVIMEPDINHVALSRLIARRTIRQTRRDVYLFGSLSIIAVIIFVTGIISPLFAPLVGLAIDAACLLYILYSR